MWALMKITSKDKLFSRRLIYSFVVETYLVDDFNNNSKFYSYWDSCSFLGTIMIIDRRRERKREGKWERAIDDCFVYSIHFQWNLPVQGIAVPGAWETKFRHTVFTISKISSATCAALTACTKAKFAVRQSFAQSEENGSKLEKFE